MRYWIIIVLVWLSFCCPFFWCCSSSLTSSSNEVGNAFSSNVKRIFKKVHVLISSAVSSAQSKYSKSPATLSGASQCFSWSSFMLKTRTNASNSGEMYLGGGNTVISLVFIIPMLSNNCVRCFTSTSDWLNPSRTTTQSDWLFSTTNLKIRKKRVFLV